MAWVGAGEHGRAGQLTNTVTTRGPEPGLWTWPTSTHTPSMSCCNERMKESVLQNQSLRIYMTQGNSRISKGSLGEGPVPMV